MHIPQVPMQGVPAQQLPHGLQQPLPVYRAYDEKFYRLTIGKTLESQKRTLGELEPPSCPGYKGIIMESAFMWTDMPHGEKLPV
ncbi:hypothetical protein F2Q69_00062276 [Brassica cretica]|uniref:Uncharacterized protein n=1 Tax=Brassica cretica TaxID=69181 RepID=A0A8S9RQ73_BRACR|nr:hypothetical protein F2Q69_00062276 [Brassica cretica]